MQFKWAPQHGIIIENGSDEAKQVSAKIQEYVKRHAQSSSIGDYSNDDNDANNGTSQILMAKRNKPAAVAVAAAATVFPRKNTAVSLAQNNSEDDDGNMLVDNKIVWAAMTSQY